MTPDEIRDAAVGRFNEIAPPKFDYGQREHGGSLLEKENLLGEMEAEVIDLWFYLQAARLRITQRRKKDE